MHFIIIVSVRYMRGIRVGIVTTVAWHWIKSDSVDGCCDPNAPPSTVRSTQHTVHSTQYAVLIVHSTQYTVVHPPHPSVENDAIISIHGTPRRKRSFCQAHRHHNTTSILLLILLILLILILFIMLLILLLSHCCLYCSYCLLYCSYRAPTL